MNIFITLGRLFYPILSMRVMQKYAGRYAELPGMESRHFKPCRSIWNSVMQYSAEVSHILDMMCVENSLLKLIGVKRVYFQ